MFYLNSYSHIVHFRKQGRLSPKTLDQVSLPSLPLTLPSRSYPILYLPLEIGPINPAKGLGERCKLPQWGRAEPQPKSNLVHFSLRI